MHTYNFVVVHTCIANSMDMTTISIAIWITLYFYQRRRLRRRHWKKFFNHDLHKIYPCWSSIVTWKNIYVFVVECVVCHTFLWMSENLVEWRLKRGKSEAISDLARHHTRRELSNDAAISSCEWTIEKWEKLNLDKIIINHWRFFFSFFYTFTLCMSGLVWKCLFFFEWWWLKSAKWVDFHVDFTIL